MQTNSVLAAIVDSKEEISFEEMKNRYPNEWIVVANPIENDTQLEITAGIPVVHGIDKKIVCWEGRKVIDEMNPTACTIIYTGQRSSSKRFMTGIFGRVK